MNRYLSAVTICFLLSCSSNDTPKPFDCNQSDLSVVLNGTEPASGCNVADGGITVIASGGAEPYTFLLNNEEMQTSGVFDHVAPGVYSILVRDKNKCEITLDNITVMAEGLSFSTHIDPDDLCIDSDGAVTVEVSSGGEQFEFKIDDGEFSEVSSFTGLSKGAHVIMARNAEGCLISLNVTVPHGNTGVSWSNDIKPIVENSCSIASCHDGFSQVDLNVYQNAKTYAADMKAMTQDGRMPFDGPALSQQEIDLIACWVDDGAPEN